MFPTIKSIFQSKKIKKNAKTITIEVILENVSLQISENRETGFQYHVGPVIFPKLHIIHTMTLLSRKQISI